MYEIAVSIAVGTIQKDLQVSLSDDMAGGALLDAIAESTPSFDPYRQSVRIERSGQTVDPSRALGGYGLRSGDYLSAVPFDRPAPQLTEVTQWSLAVVEGPRAGETIRLDERSVVLGRSSASSGPVLDLGDPAVSRRHAIVDTERGLVIRDAGSSYGTFVNGSPADEAGFTLSAGDRIVLGDTVLVVNRPTIVLDHAASVPVHVGGAPLPDQVRPHLVAEAGTLRFNRPPRVIHPAPEAQIEIPAAPDTPPKRRVPIGSSLVPIFMGLIIYIVVRNPLFILFMAAGPLMAIWSYTDDRRSGRKDFRAKSTQYLQELTGLEDRIRSAHARSVAWRNDQHPDAGQVLAMADGQQPTLWSRRPTDADFLDVRVGLADHPSLVSVTLDDRGAEELVEQARRLEAAFRIDAAVPAVAPLRSLGALGVVGGPSDLDDAARWMVSQLVAHHSPRDVALAVLAPDHGRAWEWVKWLPHVHRLDPEARSVAADDDEASRLFGALGDLGRRRADDDETGIRGGPRLYSPHVVVVVQPPLRLSPREMGTFLEQATQYGFSVIWLDTDEHSLPGAAGGIVRYARGQATFTATADGYRIGAIRPDAFSTRQATHLARSLSPLRDATAGGEGADLPTSVPLMELYQPPPDVPEVLIDQWQVAASGALGATIGMAEDGPFRVDLRHDGPHGLVAGTTGAGKSEFLQSLVAALAIEHSPSRLNFVLVDYKGGAAFKDATDLPHTVGFVTDLDARLTHRALTSLNAELKYRESLLARHGAKDLYDLEHARPSAAPASLLIVIDEFAALRTEVPEFVDGVVDIAQRGRSLGVHLLLATQKPGGVITGAIQANTNLRIALRVSDPQESNDVIGRADAAQIGRSTPGRAFARTGPTELTAFQAAYVGGTTSTDSVDESAGTSTFHFSQVERVAMAQAVRHGTDGPTDLVNIVSAAKVASSRLGIPEPRRPWLPELPELLPWSEAVSESVEPAEHLSVPIGLEDHPATQHQDVHTFDLEATGHLLIYGSAGAGKTTLLRSMAASVAAMTDPRATHLYGLDFAGHGLASIAPLPHCGDVVFGEEIDRVRRMISLLSGWAGQRRELFGTHGAASLTEYRRHADLDPVPRVVVLLDGFAQFWSVMEPLDRSQHVEAFTRLIGEGRSLGLHFVMTADRRGAVPPIIGSTVSGRMVLRMDNPDEYLNLGLPELAKSTPLPDGRAFVGDREVQIAALCPPDADPTGAVQAAQITELGNRLTDRWGMGTAVRMALLPDEVAVEELERPSVEGLVPIGLDEATMATATVDLAETPGFLVVGPDRSGRSTALRTVRHGLIAHGGQLESLLLSPRRSPLLEDEDWSDVARGIDQCAELAERLSVELDGSAAGGQGRRRLIVIDDADELTDGKAAMALATVISRARDANAVVVVAMSMFKAQRAITPWVQALKSSRHGLLLQPEGDHDGDGDVLHTRLPRRSGMRFPPGRGYLIARGSAELVQVARIAARADD